MAGQAVFSRSSGAVKRDAVPAIVTTICNLLARLIQSTLWFYAIAKNNNRFA
jgi:hypothetical protein